MQKTMTTHDYIGKWSAHTKVCAYNHTSANCTYLFRNTHTKTLECAFLVMSKCTSGLTIDTCSAAPTRKIETPAFRSADGFRFF